MSGGRPAELRLLLHGEFVPNPGRSTVEVGDGPGGARHRTGLSVPPRSATDKVSATFGMAELGRGDLASGLVIADSGVRGAREIAIMRPIGALDFFGTTARRR